MPTFLMAQDGENAAPEAPATTESAPAATPEATPAPTPEPTPAPEAQPAPTEGATEAQEGVQQRRDRTQPPRQEPSLGEFRLNIDRGMRMLSLSVEGQEGRASAQVIVGTEFTTHINFDNQSETPFDAVRILLSYSTESLEPIAINDSPIAANLLGDPVAEVDTQFGMILYEAKLAEPIVIRDAPVLSVRWRALRVVPSTPIEFSTRQDIFTTIAYENTDLLGNRRIQGDGTLSMSVQILPEDPREAEAMLTEPSLFLRTDEKLGGVQLYLRRQPEPVYAGKPFYVDIILDNRAFSMVDGLSVLLQFDPEVLTILDVDRDNWITRETNIHDGPFRDMWPWNMHIDNTVQQKRGIISYRKATTDGEMTRGKYGPIARIWAVAERPTRGTPILFKFSERPRSPGTRVTYVGENALGDLTVPNDGATGLVMAVAPARDRGQ